MAAEKQFERSAYDSYLRKLSEEEDGFRHSFRTAFFQAMHEELTGRQYEVLWMGEKFIKSKGIIWPLFYTAVFYLVFNGLLTLLFGWIEKKVDYFK